MIVRTLLGLALSGAVIAAVVDGVMRRMGFAHVEWPLRTLCGLLAFLVLGYLIGNRRRRRAAPPSTVAPPAAMGLSDEEIFDYANRAGRHSRMMGETHGGPDAAPLGSVDQFASLLTDSTRLEDAREEVAIKGDFLESRVVLEFSLADQPTGKDAMVVVPVIRRKGQEFNSLKVTSATDEPLPKLSPATTFGYLALTVFTVFTVFVINGAKRPLTRDERSALYAIVRLMCREGTVDEAVVREDFAKATAALTIAEHHRERLLDLCLFFAANTVVAVVAPLWCDRLRIQYEYVLAPYDRLGTGHDRIRTLVGLRPYRYRIPLLYPFAADRYSLRVTGSPVQFVYRHWLCLPVPDGQPVPAGQVQSQPPVPWASTDNVAVALGTDAGLPHADLRTRGLNKVPPKPVECVVEFEEIPPGALGQATIISWVCTALVLLFAFILPTLPAAGSGSDLAALLLASPAFAATWVGQSAERVQQSSLTTYAGLAAAGLVSVASSVLFLIQGGVAARLSVAHIGVLHLFTLPKFEAPWLAIGFFSLTATLVLTLRLRHRMTRYLTALARRGTAQ